MLSTSQKLLHRAKSLRRLHHCTKAADETPAMPPSTDRPRTHYGGSSSSPSYSNASASTASDDELMLDAFHFRQVSTCSHASRASSSWSSTASTTSTTSSSSSKIQWDSLRLHPPPMPRTPRYDAGRSFYYEDAPFDFGFDKDEDKEDYYYHHDAADIHLVSSDEDADVFQGLSPPPPRHLKLHAHPSAASPPQPAEPAAESASPVTPRAQQSNDSECDRFFKRGDWKRRGIVFNGYDHVL